MRKKIVRFGLVGVFNTLFNLLLFNILLFGLGLSVNWSNLISVVISISLSFVLNSRFVFEAAGLPRSRFQTYGLFFASSLFSQIVVQQLVITLFIYHLTGPAHLITTIANHLPLLSHLSQRFYLVNTAKILAVGASLTTNYLLYDKLVFAAKPAGKPKDI